MPEQPNGKRSKTERTIQKKRHCDRLKEGGHLVYSLVFFEDIIMLVVIKCCT